MNQFLFHVNGTHYGIVRAVDGARARCRLEEQFGARGIVIHSCEIHGVLSSYFHVQELNGTVHANDRPASETDPASGGTPAQDA